jgi:glutathione S-transferase
MCLFEKDISWMSRPLNLASDEHLTPAYLAINPNGVVPTLVHDGKPIIDSSVICEYLDEIIPLPRLSPSDPVRRAAMRSWMRFIEEVPTTAIRFPSFHMAIARRYQDLSESDFRERVANVRPLRKHFYRRMGSAGFDRDDVVAALEELKNTLERMEKALASGPWLIGDELTLADIVVMPTIDRLADLGLSADWPTRFPGVSDWYARLQRRPAFRKTYSAGSRLSENMTIRPLAWT